MKEEPYLLYEHTPTDHIECKKLYTALNYTRSRLMASL